MLPTSIWLLCLSVLGVRAQSSSEESSATSSSGGTATTSTAMTTGAVLETLTGDQLESLTRVTGSGIEYESVTSQITVEPSTTSTANATDAGTTVLTSSTLISGSDYSATRITRTTKSRSVTVIGADSTSGGSIASGTESSTSSAAIPVNTIPCNNYPEFCERSYSNITEVCAHNSAFSIENNAASNQERSITTQLDDGVRMIQGETRLVNDTIYMCHSSCDLLNAGKWQDELETLVSWLEANPYDVVTVLIVNSMYVQVGNYTPAIENSGIRPYLYEPDFIPQHRDQWPTLGEMILSGKRVVMFMDYEANQQKVPYILNEFTHMWETPFSPTNQSFPCDIQRPPRLGEDAAKENFMYMANHNLNTAISISSFGFGGSAGTDGGVLIPTTSELNTTNAAGYEEGMLGAMNRDCTEMWDRPPNFLLVDYYNVGEPEAGSVFEVAARANGVTYNRQLVNPKSAAPSLLKGQGMGKSSLAGLVAAIGFAIMLTW